MARIEINDAGIDELFSDPAGEVAAAVERATYAVENEAKRLLLLPGSGRLYTRRFYRDGQGRLRMGGERPPHVASAPGEPAASDTGQLLASVEHRMGEDEHGVYGEVGSRLAHAEYTELGTRDMAPRPWLRPALDVLKAEQG